MVTYDPAKHISASELRQLQVHVPEDVPDWAFIPRESVRKPAAWQNMRSTADVGEPPWEWEFLEPWMWEPEKPAEERPPVVDDEGERADWIDPEES
jgi:hypothetical protein